MTSSTDKIVFSIKSIKYSFLSSSYISNIIVDGKEYYHVEGYYQCMKHYGFNDKAVEHIRNVLSPQVCRKVGTGYYATDQQEREWTTEKKISSVKLATMVKFITNSELSNKLLNTGSATLIDSGSDEFWANGKNNDGNNMMGKILMEVRSVLRSINGLN